MPHLAATPTVSVASEWVGIDGVAPDRSLIQAGADELYNPATQRVYTQAWWEILPAPSVPILSLAVSPGDSIRVTIRQLAGAQWAITVSDISTGGSFTIEPTYRGPAASAEWVVEAPTDGTTGEEYPLGAYSPPVLFRDLQAAGPETTLTRVAMVQGGATVSAPSALTATGFSVSYGGPAAGGAAADATPAPAPAPSLRVYTIAPGQSLRLTMTGGTPGLTAEWQVSPDRITWTPLAAVSFDAAGQSSYTFAPTTTAFYRLYVPSLAQAEPWTLELVVPLGGNIPTIFTVTAGAPATLTEAGPPNSEFTLERSFDARIWMALAQRTTDAAGTATYTFTPDATAYYRAQFPDGTAAGLGVVLPPLSSGIVLAGPPVITWGTGATLRVSVGTGGNRAVEILATRDAITWTRVALLTTDAQGTASVTIRPTTTAWYRAVVAEDHDLPAETSAAIRMVVRQLALAKGAGRPVMVPRGAPVTRSAVLRPDRPGLPVPVAIFCILRWTGARWQLVRSIVASADASGWPGSPPRSTRAGPGRARRWTRRSRTRRPAHGPRPGASWCDRRPLGSTINSVPVTRSSRDAPSARTTRRSFVGTGIWTRTPVLGRRAAKPGS